MRDGVRLSATPADVEALGDAASDAALAGAMYISRRWPEGGAGEKYLLDVASVIELSILAYLKLAANDIPPNGPGEETRGCTPR